MRDYELYADADRVFGTDDMPICVENAEKEGFTPEQAENCEADNHICTHCPFNDRRSIT
jgi:hypothetical protein